ncbi:MAG TPA: hypothetical protein VMP10_03390, partial [Chloroflexota bacterium]|nr:hypothetical protein [Chloroflexota bacterium]
MAERAQGPKGAQPIQATKPQSEIGVNVEGATAVASQFLGQSEFAGGEAEDRRQDNPSFLTNLRRSDPRSRASTLTALQRSVGNAAVVRLIAAAPSRVAVIQRIEPGFDAPSEDRGVPPNLHTMSNAERISAIEGLFSSGRANSTNLDIMWSSFGNSELEVARSHADLFTKSLAQASGIATHAPLKVLKDKFKSDVEGQALNYLSSNRDYVAEEMKKIGAHGLEGSDQNPTAEQQHELREAQKVAERLAETKKAINGFKSIPL